MVEGRRGIERVRGMEVTVSWGCWRMQQPSRGGGWRTSLTKGENESVFEGRWWMVVVDG